MKKNICVVLPTKNEEKIIADVLKEIKEVFEKNDYKEPVIIITDDSKDRTREIAKSQGIIVVNGGGKGLGYAMFKGLKESLKYNPDYIVSFDSDGQCDPNEIPEFIKPLELEEADMVIGSRFKKPNLIEYRYKLINRLGIIILTKILRSFTGLKITDSHGGIRAMKSDVVREMEMLGVHTYVQEAIIDAREKGFMIKEIPTRWRKRKHGKSRVVSSIPSYVFYSLPILIIRSKQHLKWLYSIGIIFVLLAVIYFFIISFQASFKFKEMFSRLPSFLLIALLILTGIQLFFFGFVLQLIKDIKYRVDRIEKK